MQESIQNKIMVNEEAFLNYWQEIDIIKEFDSHELEGALDQPVRKAIIQILSEGRTIVDSEGNERRIRVMNASQLLERINEMAASDKNNYHLEPIKRSNLYYHINALEEKGFIIECGLIPKKNRLISYYGRSARVFLLNYEKDEHKPPLLRDESLPTVMGAINPDLNEKEIASIINGLNLMAKEVDTKPIHDWIKSNERVLRASDLDIRHLHGVFYKILSLDDETISAMRAFAKAMKLDI